MTVLLWDDPADSRPVGEPLYAARNARDLEPYYSIHVEAMTAEDLNDKSAIAAELAWRDQRLAAASDDICRMARELVTLRERL